jgi:hypothetical protein
MAIVETVIDDRYFKSRRGIRVSNPERRSVDGRPGFEANKDLFSF